MEAEQAGKEENKDIKDIRGKPKAPFHIFLVWFFSLSYGIFCSLAYLFDFNI